MKHVPHDPLTLARFPVGTKTVTIAPPEGLETYVNSIEGYVYANPTNLKAPAQFFFVYEFVNEKEKEEFEQTGKILLSFLGSVPIFSMGALGVKQKENTDNQLPTPEDNNNSN